MRLPSIVLLFAVTVALTAALVSCGSPEDTGEAPAPQTTPAPEPAPAADLPVDPSVFLVDGTESEPTTVVFSNGVKTVTFIPMIHVATPAFYGAVADKVSELKQRGATLYYEYIDFDLLSEGDKRKVRAMVGILPTPALYADAADEGYVGQDPTSFLGLVNDKDVNVDVTAKELIEAYESKFGTIQVEGEDARSDLSELATTILPPERTAAIVLDHRNQQVADTISAGPHEDIVLLFGAAHGPGILAKLRALDSKWKRTH